MEKQKNLPTLLLFLGVVIFGAVFFNFRSNYQSATILRSNITTPIDKDQKSDEIDPDVLKDIMDNVGDVDEISVPTIGGVMKMITIPKKVYVLGGKTNTTLLNDIWSTENPSTMTWSNIIPTGTTWSPTALYNDALYFKNKIWIFNHSYTGGNGALWMTNNATSWIKKTYPVYPARQGFSTVSFGGKMYYMGGCNNYIYVKICYNDVYSSIDGSTWTTSTAPWSARYHGAIANFDGKIWFMGGGNTTNTNEVWTYDGNVWNQEPNAPWSARSHHSATLFKGKLYVIGGNVNSNEVWSYNSTTNIWTQEPNGPWTSRIDHSSFTANGKLWVGAGNDGVNVLNDLWSSTNGKVWVPEPNATWGARSQQSFVTTPVTFGQ